MQGNGHRRQLRHFLHLEQKSLKSIMEKKWNVYTWVLSFLTSKQKTITKLSIDTNEH